MNDLMITSLKTYWERLRAGRIAPFRAEIDPREFEIALENMFIVERIAPGNLRIRLAGMKVCEMMGMEVRGMQPGLFIAEEDRTRFDRLIDVVMTEPAVVELGLEAPVRPQGYRATMLLMPLRSDFGEINRVLGCMSGESEFFQPPLAFALREISINPIDACDEGEGRRTALPGFAEERQAFVPAAGAFGGPKLRAIEGNPDAPTGKSAAKPKLRVIDGK
jgi:hypothetical protein